MKKTKLIPLFLTIIVIIAIITSYKNITKQINKNETNKQTEEKIEEIAEENPNENAEPNIETQTTDTNTNNIYDMAGNVNEFTLESDSSPGRRYRGGSLTEYASNFPASQRYYSSPSVSNNYYGFRAYLYIK